MEQARARVHVHDPRRTWSAPALPSATAGEGPPPRRSPPVEMRRERERRRAREQPRCGEMAGGTAAECAAVCCCVPLTVLELVVLAAVRAPAALCRRAVLARRRRRRAKRAACTKKEMEDLLASEGAFAKAWRKEDWSVETTRLPDEAVEAEREVWASFQGAGFWRSPSQREVRK